MEAHAVVFTGPNQVVFQKITCPEPGSEDVVVELHHSWISNGTEGSFLRGERISGDVAWRPGDWVFASLSKVCGMFDNQFAGHVSPSVCAQGALLPLPKGVDPVAFSGLVLTQVGYNCGTRAPVTPGQVAVVVGDGLVGQWSGQTLTQLGAKVVMIGRHDDRLARFGRFGATVRSGGDNGVAASARAGPRTRAGARGNGRQRAGAAGSKAESGKRKPENGA